MSGDSSEAYVGWLNPSQTEVDQGGSSTLVRATDGDATEDDLLSAFSVQPRMDRSMERPIREALALVGYRVGTRLDDHENSHVYRGQRVATGEPVAIKVLVEQASDKTSAVRRFRQESHIMMALRHRSLVKAIGHGKVGTIHYVILELADGLNLRERVERDGPLSPGLAAWVAWQAAGVLAYVHQHGIVHRDVKPSNLVLTRDGVVKLLDLGLARAADQAEGSITLMFHDRLLGTPDFIAPEQVLDSHQVDARADLYSLGCTLYYLLTGQVPFPGTGVVDCLLRRQTAEPKPLCEVRPEIPAGLAAVCEKLMARRPADRYQLAAEAAADLIRWAPQDCAFAR